MTTAQAVGAASHTRWSPQCESAASQYRAGLIRFESGRVLVFHGGVFGRSSRMNGKPSSPVLRGLGASNGARPLDHVHLRVNHKAVMFGGQLARNKTQGCSVLGSVPEPKPQPLLKATKFEYRHQTLVHQLIIGAAFLTYLVDREDIVWRLVKNTATPHALERFVFIVATMFIAIGVGFCTWGRAQRHPQYLGDFSYAIGLGSLVPVAGFLILVGGEALRVFRLAGGIDDRAWNWQSVLAAPTPLARPDWRKAFRQEAAKWGILVAMTVFVITLEDRHVEILVLASFLLGMLLNGPTVRTRLPDN